MITHILLFNQPIPGEVVVRFIDWIRELILEIREFARKDKELI